MLGVVCICGNDGTGKSSVTAALNAMARADGNAASLHAVERSTPDDLHDAVNIKFFDAETLAYTYERAAPAAAPIRSLANGTPVFWVILDATVETCVRRIRARCGPHTAWDSPKALEYFRARFAECAAFHGIPIIRTDDMDVPGVCERVLEAVNDHAAEVERANIRDLTDANIQARDVESLLVEQLTAAHTAAFELAHPGVSSNAAFVCRWLVTQGPVVVARDRITVGDVSITRAVGEPVFRLATEGESKRVYRLLTDNPYLADYAVIVLKPTIYSHSMQASGEIADLGAIRARGTNLFLEMMWRNQLEHAYRSVNAHGVILSRWVDDIPPVEVVFKRVCEGTDKHSYHGMRATPGIILADTGEYVTGPYVRFDWRNPNHVTVATGESVTADPFYYLRESAVGKSAFFAECLHENAAVRPMGDKTVSPDILEQVIDVSAARARVVRMYCTIAAYLGDAGLEVKDACFMLDRKGAMFWSEINQDCMRIGTRSSATTFDKDIWRAGGSSAKATITRKWTDLNNILEAAFRANRFQDADMHVATHACAQTAHAITHDGRLRVPDAYARIYAAILQCPSPITSPRPKRIIVTMDLFDGAPVLVHSGQVHAIHSDGDVTKAFEKIAIFTDILVVDLNGALATGRSNRAIVNELAKKYYVHVGGGLRTLNDVQDVLSSSARRAVVSSNTDPAFLASIPPARLIVELSVDANNRVLTHGRTVVLPDTDVRTRMRELADLGVTVISITFHAAEGHLIGLPRQQIADIARDLPASVEKLVIAGGITSLDDLEFLWSLDRVVPQVGSALWTGRFTAGQVYSAMATFDPHTRTVVAVLQHTDGTVLGVVHMDQVALERTCDTRLLHKFSRKERRVVCKGDTSGNYQRVVKVSLDCDNDAVLVTVEGAAPFCHTLNASCFSNQSPVKAGVGVLNNHIHAQNSARSYVAQMKANPGLALAKMMEELWEIASASKDAQVDECADLLVHFLMYVNGKGISLNDILNELNARRWNPRLVVTRQEKCLTVAGDRIVIGMASEKYTKWTRQFLENHLGIRLHDRKNDRALEIAYDVCDQAKHDLAFKGVRVSFVGMRPKDMPYMVTSGAIDGAITFSTIIDNQPKVFKAVTEHVVGNIELALIKRKADTIDVSAWTPLCKAIIATEHMVDVNRYLTVDLGIPSSAFSLTHVLGSSESFLVNETKRPYTLCDAIVESGATLDANELEVWRVVRGREDIKIGLYTRL